MSFHEETNTNIAFPTNEKVERVGRPSTVIVPTSSAPTAAPGKTTPDIGTARLSRMHKILRAPCSLIGWIAMLYSHFGSYVPAAVLQYGLNQGVGHSVFHMARKVYVSSIGLDGATSARYVAAGHVPWSVKPLYGMLSDAVPLLGFRRTPYFLLGGIAGVMAYLIAAIVQPTGSGIVFMLVLFNISIAMPDVMIDAVCAEQSKKSPAHASDLQSLSWGSFALGGLIGSATSGMLVDTMGPIPVFCMGVVCPLGVVFAAGTRMLPEEQLPKEERRIDTTWVRSHMDLVLLAVFMSTISVLLSILQTVTDDMKARAVATLVAGVVLITGVYLVLRRTSEILARTAVFIVLRQCLQPSNGEAMFQWLTKYENGPQFSPTLIGWVDIFGNVGLFVGITVYNKYCRNVSYQKVFAFAQFGLALTNLFDVALVFRWNRAVGIPDVVMLLGDESASNAVQRFCSLPMFVLASKVCPDNVEATLFALLMALSNFGNSIGDLLGVSVLEVAGVVDGNFDNFGEVTLAKSFFRLLPILIIPVLVPNISQSDAIYPETDEEHGQEVDGCDSPELRTEMSCASAVASNHSTDTLGKLKVETSFSSTSTGEGLIYNLQSRQSSQTSLSVADDVLDAEP
eukprot:TRINITY_DN2503_c0_g1_i1.p1 TRINITY_DN2503_c0_g1~~TRINITY_DN2503_c0_g1_i1.p1  ORF type:complete len:643 (+),score=103.43 TRINITY_DN2503_c0_g1_i1:56-1930(+)